MASTRKNQLKDTKENNNNNNNNTNNHSNTKKNKNDNSNSNKNKHTPPKAVALLSGGLDSNLAVRMMQEQGVEVEAIAVKTPFCDFDCGKGCGHRVKEVAIDLGINLKTVYFGEEYLKMLKDPKYGYGSGMNPCIDCRGMMYNAAKEHMKKIGADFIITGEVLGQRPMSQNANALKIIENETQTNGKIVRPLSFRHLPLTDAEAQGLVNREQLGGIKGRSRKGQLQLAKKYDIADPPNSAGGCLLTDPAFSKRVRDLYDHSKDTIPDINDVELLKIGRHFRLSENTKLIVGRNKMENEVLESLKRDDDIIIEVSNHVGPTCILRTKKQSEKEIETAAATALRYSDSPKGEISNVRVRMGHEKEEKDKELQVSPIDDKLLNEMRI